MKLFSEAMAALVLALFYLCRACAMSVFCKKYLNISRASEAVFVMLMFGNYTVLGYTVGKGIPIPYIVLASWNHVCLLGLVFLLFQGDKVRKILAPVLCEVCSGDSRDMLDVKTPEILISGLP